MFNHSGNAKRRQYGQGMMEYIIGKTVRNQSAGLAKELSGNKADASITAAGTAATSATTRADTTKGLAEYNKDNDAK